MVCEQGLKVLEHTKREEWREEVKEETGRKDGWRGRRKEGREGGREEGIRIPSKSLSLDPWREEIK